MKTQIIILIVIVSIINPVKLFSQWNIIQDYGQSYNFNDIFMSSDSVGYITDGNVGITGSNILKTVDSGNTWDVINTLPGYEEPTSIFFINDSIGFISAHYYSSRKIYMTIDGGNSFSSSNIDYTPSKLFFPSDSIGYLFCQNSNVFYKTTNTGSSWTQNTFPATINYHPSTYFINNDIGFIVNNDSSIIYKTIDGGTSWNTINITSTENLNFIHFLNDTTGYLNGQNVLWKTIDGGNNWSLLNDYSFNNSLKKTQFLNDSIGYAFGSVDYTILKTTDGGVSWNQQLIDMSYYWEYYDMTFLNDTVGFVIGGSGIDATENGIILKTINGGDNHTIISEMTYNDFQVTNYPNPFVNHTTIEYSLNQLSSTVVNVIIYDITGKKIMYIYPNSYNSTNKINIDFSNYPSGIYYYSIIAEGQIIETNKMICIKE